MMTWDEWLKSLDEREAKILRHFPLDSFERKNVAMLQSLTDALVKKCSNSFCRWPIKVFHDTNYAVPFVGEVCATCHDLHTAISIMNPFLKNGRFFSDAHFAWTREAEAQKQRRKNMGLDDNNAVS